MTTYYLEIEYTRADGSKFHELGTHVIATVDGRWAAWRQSDALVQNARFICSDSENYTAILLGVQVPGDYSRHTRPLPDGSRNVSIAPMSADERKQYRADGGYWHP